MILAGKKQSVLQLEYLVNTLSLSGLGVKFNQSPGTGYEEDPQT